MSDGAVDRATLKGLTTDNQYELKAAERLQRIDALYKKMLNRYSFAQHFFNETNVFIDSGKRQQQQLQQLEKIYPANP